MRRDCIHSIKQLKNEKETFILLAANKSKIRGQKNSISLMNLEFGERVIDNQLNTIYSTYPNCEIFLATGFDSENVIRYVINKYKNVRIVENLDYKNTSSLHTLRTVINLTLSSGLHIIHADRLFNSRAITPKNKNKSFIYTHKMDKSNYQMGVCYQNKKLMNMSYGLPSVWSEILFISRKDYDEVKLAINEIESNGIYSIYEFINRTTDRIEYFVDDDKSIEVEDLKEVYDENFSLYTQK